MGLLNICFICVLAISAASMHEPDTQDSASQNLSEPSLQPKISPWNSQLKLTLFSVTGNTNAMRSAFFFGVSKQWQRWNAQLWIENHYGKIQPNNTPSPTEIIDHKGEIRLVGERQYNQNLSFYILAGTATNRAANIAYQLYGEIGENLIWWEYMEDDSIKNKLRTSIGWRNMREKHQQYDSYATSLPNSVTIAYGPIFRANFLYGVSPNTFFSQDAEILQELSEQANTRCTSTTGLTVYIQNGPSISLNYTIRYIGIPAPSKRPTDTELVAGINWMLRSVN